MLSVQLVEKLPNIGISEKEANVRNKLSRGQVLCGVPVVMPISRWIFVVAFGLALPASAGWPQPATENQPRQEERAADGEQSGAQDQSNADLLAPILENIEAAIRELKPENDEIEVQRRQDTERRDLDAQESMARWAELMFYATAATVVLTAIALFAIIRTLHHTRRAADAAVDAVVAAQETVEVTSDIGKRQLRAYINVSEAYVELHESIDTIVLVVRLKNFGATPAHRVRQSSASIFSPYPWDGGPDIDKPEPSFGASCGPGAEFAAVVRLWDFGDITLEEAWSAVRAGRSGFWIQGMIEYQDIFGNAHETKYRYVLGGRLADQSNTLHAYGDQNVAS